MLPANLDAKRFASYPPQAQALVLAHLEVLRQLPLSFLPSLLRELIEYDYKFPAERAAIERELACLSALTPTDRTAWFRAFSQVRLSPAQEQFDWVSRPTRFTEDLSAYLWSTHQMAAFREAAVAYGSRVRSSAVSAPLPTRRLGIAIIGQGVATYQGPLFRSLREHGTCFTAVSPADGLVQLLAAVASRAQAHPAPYAHWYVDGGTAASHSPSLTSISYAALDPARETLLRSIQREVSKPGMGPEELRSYLTRLSPGDLGLRGDDLLDRFQMKLLTEGSGTQIFSTTFAQWTTREILRRAEALTLLVRFAPRQRQRPMNELLASHPGTLEFDPVGSLVDADKAAYYQWINQGRLPGAEQSAFLVWFEGHRTALAIGPSLQRGVESRSVVTLAELQAMALS